MKDKARFCAFNAVRRVIGGAYSNLVLPKEIEGLDKAFAEAIVLGSLERKITLEFVVSRMTQRMPQEDVLALLMTGIYQIIYMDRVPDNAACDETVSIAKELYGNKTAGFVNAVLRNVCRSKAQILSDIAEAEGYIKYSVNQELYTLIEQQYPQDAERIFNAFFGAQSMHLRVNTLKATADEIANTVGGAVINQTCVEATTPNNAIKLLDKGEFYVQGRASQEAVRLLNAMPDNTVIDVCACPGGKSLGAAIDMENRGRVYSFDLHGNKLPLINKSAEGLGIDIIETNVWDARKVNETLIGVADRVICDVPCSGTGVMGSKPEIKYKSPRDFHGLYTTQRAIIESASKYLKMGGAMVYSTCSINKKENEEIVNEFLCNNNNFSLVYQRTFLPFEEIGEGFYMAKLIREN